jgi:polysaccharide export outer membrane protein
MYKRSSRLLLVYTLFAYMCISFSSCLTLKQVKLFQDIPDSTKLEALKLPKFTPPVINPDDILSITIITTDITATSSLNLANNISTSTPVGAGSGSGGSGSSDGGYLVGKDGNIDMPELGKINVAGLTTAEAREVIRKRALEYFKDPLVVVKSKNLKLTILGEIEKPGTYNIANEKVTIMDALAYSGDFTAYGRRDNILLLRQNDNNTLSYVRLNVKSSELLRSPYYYLQNNDILYIEPTAGKAATSDAIFSRNISYITIGLGLITTILFLVKR